MKAMKVMIVACLFATASAPPPQASDVEQVVAHHVSAMKAAALDEIMGDYAEGVVVITPPGLMPSQGKPGERGVFVGRQNARAVFAKLTNDENIGGIRGMKTRIATLGEGVGILHWTQFGGTPQEVTGHDLFVVDHGQITLQDIVIESAPQ
jgi:hypothetical protein